MPSRPSLPSVVSVDTDTLLHTLYSRVPLSHSRLAPSDNRSRLACREPRPQGADGADPSLRLQHVTRPDLLENHCPAPASDLRGNKPVSLATPNQRIPRAFLLELSEKTISC